MQITRLTNCASILVLAFVLFTCTRLLAAVTASISGTVTDPSGAVVVGATVTATNVDTHIVTTQTTNAQGFYSFQALPLGNYTIDIEKSGFKSYRQTGLVLDVSSALVADAALQVGSATEKVEVSSMAVRVETESTQMGEVITGKQMVEVPLVSRSYTDLLALQPGVVSQASQLTGAYAGPFISAGFAVPLVSGTLNSGALSVNGNREAANGFIINGMSAQEMGYSGAGAIPNLDSIAEFRILTNNFDAEYGHYSGGLINVATKSGTNQWHGDVFEFFRNTGLNASNFFSNGPKSSYHQNEFGGTLGGPIKANKIFFFADYQGNRLVQGVTQVVPGAPSAATESGHFTGIEQSLLGKAVNGAGWASALSAQLGQPVFNNEPYFTTTCTTTAQCVFPNAFLSPAKFSPIATNLLHFITPAADSTIIPAGQPGAGTGTFATNAGKIDVSDNKGSGRLDANSNYGLLTAYFYFDKYNRTDPYWPSNAPLYPGFQVGSNGTTYNVSLGDTKTISATTVNQLIFGYFRLDTHFNIPNGGTGVKLSDLGFQTAPGNQQGIFVGAPHFQGVPEIDFNNFVIGVPSRPNGLIDNIYQVVDDFSKVIGTHTIKLGGEYHYNQLEEALIDNVANGNFFFGSNFSGQPSETGSDFVDFLLGAPSQFIQGQSYPSYGRSWYFGLYGQDSWRIKSNLTINYGLRYDVNPPWREKYNEIQTLIPGEQSVVFPGSPTGWVFPGDPHVPSTLAPTRWNNFSPRLGLAYSFGDYEGFLGKILGKPGESSLRASYGIFYTSFEGATDFNEIGDAPFGNFLVSNLTEFATPYNIRSSGAAAFNVNPFPVPVPPKHFSAKNPAPGPPIGQAAWVDHFAWNQAFGTLSSAPAFFNGNRLPYNETYMLSFQRQLTHVDLLDLSYVGSQGHRLLASMSANPGNPALCLSLSQPNEVAPGTPTCGPSGENTIFTPALGPQVLGTRSPFGGVYLFNPPPPNPNPLPIIPFGNDSYFITAGSSSYNSFQLNWRHTGARLQLLVGYTWSQALDNSSGYGEQFNPVNSKISRGLSGFDTTNNFVASYAYNLPIDKLGGPKALTNGWQISGITRFATGLPVTIVETDDQSLLGTSVGGPIPLPVDTPNQVAPLGITNPRNNPSHFFFNPLAFQPSALGVEGDARRRFFHGPGVNNWDFAVLKNTVITERFTLQFRSEFYNLFNHAQFLTPNGIVAFSGITTAGGATTGTPSASFATVTNTLPQRIVQLSLKLLF
jgi:hypothetical protein